MKNQTKMKKNNNHVKNKAEKQAENTPVPHTRTLKT